MDQSTTTAKTASATEFRRAIVPSLVDVLRSEARLLRELSSVMTSQRDALAAADASAVEDSVYAVHRVLHTMSAARDRRKSINRLLGEAEDLPIGELDLVLGPAMTADLRAACQDLADAASELGERLDLTRQALRAAVAAGQASG